MPLLLAVLLLACADKAVDSSDGGSSTDGGTTSDGGFIGGEFPPGCYRNWTGAPCSTEWTGLYNCPQSPCDQAYICQPGGDVWPLSWAEASVPCECIDLETGALLTAKTGCEGWAESSTTGASTTGASTTGASTTGASTTGASTTGSGTP